MNSAREALRRDERETQRRGLFQWTLDFYVLRRFALLYVGNLISFSLVYVLIDAFENLPEFASHAENLGDLLALCLRYYGATIPAVFCQLLGPVVALTAGLFTVTLFHRGNELVPMIANGRPFWRIVAPILACGFVLSLATFAMQELWLPRMSQSFKALSTQKKGKEIVSNQTYHDSKTGVLISIRKYHIPRKMAESVTVIPIPGRAGSDEQRYEYYIWAKSMRWVKPEFEKIGYWLLEGARRQTYDREWKENGGTNLVPPPHRGTSQSVPLLFDSLPEMKLETTLIPEDIESEREGVLYMHLGDLRRKRDSSIDRRWAVQYYQRFASPFGALVLLFVGLPILRRFGSRNVFFGALLSAAVACAFVILNSATSKLALQGFIPASLGAWFGALFFTALGATWLRNG